MSDKNITHKFHIIDPSINPILTSFSLFIFLLNFIFFMRNVNTYTTIGFILTVSLLLFSLFIWWKDIIKEGIIDKAHNELVQKGLKIGMVLFIITELLFFCGYFTSFFNAWVGPYILENVWDKIYSSWPPKEIQTIDTWSIPFINTCILLLSGSSLTWAHYSLLNNDNQNLINGLFITVILGFIFIILQIFEFIHSSFNFVEEGINSLYTSNFYMLTGLHGAHVIVGTIFLTICLIRASKLHFTAQNHLGLEFASWYWHFVDIVWIFVFIFLYVLAV